MATDLGFIKFRKDHSYAKRAPTLVSNTAAGADELARWVLDWNGVPYRDERHAPYLCTGVADKLSGGRGGRNHPVLIHTDALIYGTDSVVQYYNQRGLPHKRLLPEDPARRAEVIGLYRRFTGPLDEAVSAYVYAQLLPDRKFASTLFTQQVPFKEKLMYRLRYAAISGGLSREWNITASSADARLALIRAEFAQVDALLADGRRYLTGDTLTLADVAFASVAAPLILPDEYAGAVSRIDKLTDAFRAVIGELRATPAGQFVLRLYHEDRPVPCARKDLPKDPHALARLGARIGLALGSRKSSLFYMLQKRFPVLKLPFVRIATVNRNDLLVEMMERDGDFTVEEINAKKMSNQKGAFFLGMDRANPQFDRERNFVRQTSRKEDLDTIRAYVRSTAGEILGHVQDFGRIDVADTLCYTVLVRLIDSYFGVPAPTEAKMKEWLRVLFYDLFLNLANNRKKHALAVTAANERREWIMELIEDRKQALKDGKTLDDNILNRLILLQGEPGNAWFDDDAIHRNIGGLITGILETTNKATILVLDELFRRPDILKGAIATAQGGDMQQMYGYVSEALRFNPAQPGVVRYCEQQQVLKGKGAKAYTIPAHTKVIALTAAAMFDPAAFPDPRKFDPERKAVYMNYGYGLHECYGKYINAVTISELTAAVLRLKHVQRAAGPAGRGTGLHQGPFPTHFVVTFDPGE